MTHRSDWVPANIDTETPSAARLYDYYLDGGNNFQCDRDLAAQVIKQFPDIKHVARANRAFLMRTVRWCAVQGIRQFLDIGCGLPSAGAVHQVAQAVDPGARVVYVDNEPVAVAHGELLLANVEGVEVIQADLRYPSTFLNHPVTRRLLDFRQPIAVLLAAVLHFVPDEDDPAGIVATIRDALPPGSMVVVSHVTADGDPNIETVRDLYRRSQNPTTWRSHDEVTALMGGLGLVAPGVVWVPLWHPGGIAEVGDPRRSSLYGAVGRVPVRR